MFTRTIFLLACFIFHFAVAAGSRQALTYSFWRPEEWGSLTVEKANCCPLLTYPVNVTSEDAFLPHFVGLGVQKSGTTSLNVFLTSNPDFARAYVKETYFMTLDYPNTFSMQDYERLWKKKATKDKVRFEMTPSYLWTPFVACRIKNTLPNMNFVAIFRDPVERTYSEYNMIRRGCHGDDVFCDLEKLDYFVAMKRALQSLYTTGCSFNKGNGGKTWNDCFQCLTKRESARKHCNNRPFYFKMKGNKKACFANENQAVTLSLYAPQLAWWYSFFPPERFVVILTHDFHKDPVTHLNRIRDKVGLGQPFTAKMLPKEGDAVINQKPYRYADIHKEDAKRLLTDFFYRPNQELYNLMEETNQGPFTPFEQGSSHSLLNDTATDILTKENTLHMTTDPSSISTSKSASTTLQTFFSMPLYMSLSIVFAIVILIQLFSFNRLW